MKKKILIVDDEGSARFLLELMLRNNFITETASSSSSAIERAARENFDIILMDINLGKTDSGIIAYKKIRELEGYEQTPIIAVTAYVMAKDRDNIISTGFDAYLAKPFEKEELLELLERLLTKKEEEKLKSHQ